MLSLLRNLLLFLVVCHSLLARDVQGLYSWHWQSSSLHSCLSEGPSDADNSGPHIGLVLSGGGSRGLAQIGVLHVLEEAGITLHCVVGTSMGALVGGLYAAGYSPAEIDSLVGNLDWSDLLRDTPDRRLMYTGRKEISDRHLAQIRFNGTRPVIRSSLTSGQKLSEVLAAMVGRAPQQAFGDFDELRVPFRAVATDLVHGRPVVLADGDLAEALLASSSVPILFQPVQRDSLLLIDGGITSNIPVQVARDLGADVVLVVDATSPLRKRDELQQAWEVADQVVTIMQREYNQRSLSQADVVIRPALGHVLLDDLDQRPRMVEEGRLAMQQALPGLQELLAFADEQSMDSLRWDDLQLRRDVHVSPPVHCAGEDLVAFLRGCDGVACRRDLEVWLNKARHDGRLQRVDLDLVQQDSLRVLQCSYKHQPLITEIDLRGLEAIFPRTDLRKPLIPARLCDTSKLREFSDSLLIELRSQGCSFADLDSAWLEGTCAVLQFRPGIVHEVRLSCDSPTIRRNMRQEFRPRRGEVFQQSLADRSVRRLFGSDLYYQVYYRLLREEGKNIVELRARAREFPVLRAGLRYSSVWYGKAFSELLWEGVSPAMLRTELFTAIGLREQHYRVRLEMDRIWRTLLTARLTLEQQRQRFIMMYGIDGHMVDRRHWNAEFSLGQQIARLGTVYFATSVEVRDEILNDNEDRFEFGRFRLQSVVDSRDTAQLTCNGEYHIVEYISAFPNEDDLPPFYRAGLHFDSWRTLWKRHTFHSTLFYGIGDSQLPSERFEFGGDTWLRSLRPNQINGRQAAGLGLEYRPRVFDTEMGGLYLSGHYTLLGLAHNSSPFMRVSDVSQEFSSSLSIGSIVGELSLGVAVLTQHELDPRTPRWRIWSELGYSF